jgi:hypothetical protein
VFRVHDTPPPPLTARPNRALRRAQPLANLTGLTVDEIRSLNPELSVGKATSATDVADGATILLPAGKLSGRDREILAGIGGGYRLYPVSCAEWTADPMAHLGVTGIVSTARGLAFEPALAIEWANNSCYVR